MASPGPTGWDIASIGGAVVMLLGAIGGGIRWLFARADQKADHLDRKEAELIIKLEARIDALESSHERLKLAVDRWRVAFKLVADDLAASNPKSAALARARRILSEAFPTDPFVPLDMMALLDKLD